MTHVDNLSQCKHLFFDVDNTLTRSKSPILPEHADILRKLSERFDIIIVSGSKQEDIAGRFAQVAPVRGFVLSQNGNHAVKPNGELLWERRLSEVQKQAIYKFIEKARAHTHPPVSDESDLIEDRGCQIAFSFLGHHEKIELKEKFDPKFEVRNRILHDLSADVEILNKNFDIEISNGGTTNFDIYLKGKNKGFNSKALIDLYQWHVDECMYFGDALLPGGNDYSVVGIIPTHQVADYKETFSILKELL